MKRILLFAGTTEGRQIAEFCAEHGIPVLACVATEYGEHLLPESGQVEVHRGRMDENAMLAMMEKESFSVAVDATHPYAACVTENIKAACQKAGLSYVRLLRSESGGAWREASSVVYRNTVQEAAAFLEGTRGTVFLTTGSKELEAFASMEDFAERVYARILPIPTMIQKAMDLGLPGSHIIGMQGPFSREMNEAMFRQAGAVYLVTKESGRTGGFSEKMEAAVSLGMTAVVIGRPTHETGMSLEEAEKLVLTLKEREPEEAEEAAGIRQETHREKAAVTEAGNMSDGCRRIVLAGIGMGDEASLTKDAEAAIRRADLIIGAGRMTAHPVCEGTETVTAYLPDDVRAAIERHPDKKRIAVLLSGDTGFFSGAEPLKEGLKPLCEAGYELEILPGISSLVCLAARAGIAWQDVYAVSAHGRSCAPAGIVCRKKKTYFLLDKRQDLGWLCSRLAEYGLGQVRVIAGRDLGAKEERVLTGTADEVREAWSRQKKAKLECALVLNPEAREEEILHLDDEEYLRKERIPMTKDAIRALSAAKMKLHRDSVIYDIGAGTGGMTMELAMAAWQGQVYAIEKKEEAANLLKENCLRFHTDQVHVIQASAPKAMEDLPAPTHVFIGGSSGNLEEIVACALQKNPKVRLMIHAVTLETMAQVVQVMKTHAFLTEEVVQVSAAQSQKAGPYHLMRGENPIFLVTLQNPEDIGNRQQSGAKAEE